MLGAVSCNHSQHCKHTQLGLCQCLFDLWVVDAMCNAICCQVRGITKKGKEFFRFTTGLTDAISQLDVAESHIWAS